MSLLSVKEYKLYSNFLNTLAKDLNKFYIQNLIKLLRYLTSLKAKGMTLLQHLTKHLKNLLD